MILGIICLILFIIGIILMFYGNDEGDFLFLSLGITSMSIGFIGIIVFIGINIEVIKSWFKI